MILKIESNSGLWNPQQLKELSSLMDNSSCVLKFLSDKTVALVVDDSDGERYTTELTKMGFKVNQDTESVDSLISGTDESKEKDQKPLTNSEENMNLNIKEDNSTVQENIPDIHIKSNDKVEVDEDVIIEDSKETSKDLDIKISDEDSKEDNEQEDSIDDISVDQYPVEEEMKNITENSNDTVEQLHEEVKEEKHLEVESKEEVIEEKKEEFKEEPKEEESMKEVENTKEEEIRKEEESVLAGFDEEPKVEENPSLDEIKDDTEVHIEEQYTEKDEQPQQTEDHKEELQEETKEEMQENNSTVEDKKEDQQEFDMENTYKDSDDDLISDVEDFIMEDSDKEEPVKVLNLDHLESKDEKVSDFYREDKTVDTIGIETYAGNLTVSFGSGLSITLALADCKDGIKTFNINGTSIYIEYMDSYCLISYDNMQIRVPTQSMKQVG